MAYATKQQDHEKRISQDGTYSVYNYIYHYLLDNYEPGQNIPKDVLYRVAKGYDVNGLSDQRLSADIDKAITNFNSNNGQHGDTGNNLGKSHESFDNIKRTVQDLRW